MQGTHGDLRARSGVISGRSFLFVSSFSLLKFGTAWRRNSSRPVRPLDSVVLDEGIAESLAADAKDFIENEKVRL